MQKPAHPEESESKDLENKQAMLAAIIDFSEDGIISKTLDGIILSWNRSAERMFGYTEAEAIGKHISLLIPGDKLQEEDMIITRIRHGQRVPPFQTERLTKDGRRIPVSISVSPIRSKDGTIIGASKIARDISNELRVMRELNDRKDEFIGVAGHELRTPITTIKAYLQLMEEHSPEPVGKSFIEKALRQVNKLNRLVTDLLDVSKIQAGRLEYNMMSCFLLPLVRESVDVLRQMYPSHRIETELPAEDIVVTADGPKIEQVMINFLTNAVKYSPDADRVALRVKKEEGRVVVAIQDWGIGIPAEHLEHIFDRYYRVNASDHVIGGLGLGLYISHEMIRRHGGAVWVTSEEGTGTVFYFSLPLPE